MVIRVFLLDSVIGASRRKLQQKVLRKTNMCAFMLEFGCK